MFTLFLHFDLSHLHEATHFKVSCVQTQALLPLFKAHCPLQEQVLISIISS